MGICPAWRTDCGGDLISVRVKRTAMTPEEKRLSKTNGVRCITDVER